MKTIVIGAFAFILIAGIFLLAWHRSLRRRYSKTIAERCRAINPLIDKLARHESISRSEVEMMVSNAALRSGIHRVLATYSRLDLFPTELLTIEKGAECFLITWLEFPTELGEAPNEIELHTTIALDDILSLTYYVFQYRMRNGHWAAQYNWMFGVVGPYGPDSNPYDVPAKIFSRFNSIDATTVTDEARWVHENIV